MVDNVVTITAGNRSQYVKPTALPVGTLVDWNGRAGIVTRPKSCDENVVVMLDNGGWINPTTLVRPHPVATRITLEVKG